MVLDDLKSKIITTLNESKLSIDAVYYVMKDVMMEVNALYNQALQQERKDAEARLEESQPEAAQSEGKEEE